MNVDPDAQVSLPAGEGDLAVAAAFAAGADDSAFGARPSAGAPAGDRSDTDSDADSDDDSDADAPPSGAPEFEFSDEETRRRIPGVIRDGSDSSEWSDSSDDEDVEELDLENMPKWLEDIKNGVKSDFDDDAAHSEPPRTKNEIAADAVPPPLPPPHVGPDEPVAHLGHVTSVVGDTVVVQSLPGSEPIDEESVLCLESRLGLGAVEEVFGPVTAPLYALRLPGKANKTTAPTREGEPEGAAGDAAEDATEEEDPAIIVAREVRVGTRVFVVEGRRRALETKGLHTKGYDNSGQNDEEVAEDDEFSDDEKEAEAKKKRRQKKRGANGEAVGAGRGSTHDGGLAAAAAAAGARTGAGAGVNARGGGTRGAGARPGFRPNNPPAAQMAYMHVGGGGAGPPGVPQPMMHGGAMMGQHATARQPGMVQMVPMQMPPTMPRGGMGAPPGMVQMVPVQMVHPGMMMQQPPPHGYPPHGGYPPHAAPQWQQQYPPAGGPGPGPGPPPPPPSHPSHPRPPPPPPPN